MRGPRRGAARWGTPGRCCRRQDAVRRRDLRRRAPSSRRDIFQDLARRRSAQRHTRERTEPQGRLETGLLLQDGELTPRRNGQDVRGPETERTRSNGVGPGRVDFRGRTFPRGGIDDRFSIRGKTSPQQVAAPEREAARRQARGAFEHGRLPEAEPGGCGTHRRAPRREETTARPETDSTRSRCDGRDRARGRKRGKIEGEVSRRLEPVVGPFLEAVEDEALQGWLNVSAAFGEGRGLLPQNGVQGFDR